MHRPIAHEDCSQNAAGTSSVAFSRARVDGKVFMRDERVLRVQGVTYGPFAPNPQGELFPTRERVCHDFTRMKEIGINSIRTYHVPPAWLLDLADREQINILVDVPWPKHVCFLDSRQAQREGRQRVREAAEQIKDRSCVLAMSVGNEIPADIVRWHGAARVEGFLSELQNVAKNVDPELLVTYANMPSTEYLDLSFLDFPTFNIYLHDPEIFRRYLFRLQNLIGDKPLLLGEIGMDTFRHGEDEQAAFLAGHLRETTLLGLAGAFIFSWTDDWHTGGFQVEDWAFGITKSDRLPKAAFERVKKVFAPSPSQLLEEICAPDPVPRVSVVVCSYNGAPTLDQCLQSLLALDYPDFEIILVDDGSTDATPEIAARFPSVHNIRQENMGLSAARNVGLQAATGGIVAYTDSDCFADVNWLTHLVHQLQYSGASAVGGPNLTPDDGWLAACVAASPGQPTHVLEKDQTAEHIPGCNMAFRREALLAINGFNPRYAKAGDDVDACWRLQQAGMWITFAPGAFVWHHRRQNPRAFLRQQAGYGEAEALLWFDHPDRFNWLGDSRWRGAMYGAGAQGLRFGRPVIYRGTFGTGLFQTLYRPGLVHWASLPCTLEWHLVALLIGVLGWDYLFMQNHPVARLEFLIMLGLPPVIAGLQAVQAPLAPRYRNLGSQLLVAALCYLQPLVRSWWRYYTRFLPPHVETPDQEVLVPGYREYLPLRGALTVEYWDEAWHERTQLLDRVTDYLSKHRWAIQIDSGWSSYDLKVYCHPWTYLELSTAQEDHGSGRRLIRVRYRLQPSAYSKVLLALGVLVAAIALNSRSVPMATGAVFLIGAVGVAWWRGTRLAAQAMTIVSSLATSLGLVRCDTVIGREEADPRETMPAIQVMHGEAEQTINRASRTTFRQPLP